MSKIDELIATTKLNDLINKKEEEKASKTVLWILAVIGAVAAVAAIAYAVYCFFTPDYLHQSTEQSIVHPSSTSSCKKAGISACFLLTCFVVLNLYLILVIEELNHTDPAVFLYTGKEFHRFCDDYRCDGYSLCKGCGWILHCIQ